MFKKLLKLLLVLLVLPYFLVPVYRFMPPASLPIIAHMVSLHETHWRWEPYHDISPNMARAVIAAEDSRFCQHNGVDWEEMGNVMDHAERKGVFGRGASTIAMQTAKNLFLWPLPGVVRKPLEIPLAMWIDFVWPKQRVATVYMNIAELGDGIYGVEAASEIYYKKPASRLSYDEAAMMASVLPNPKHRNPAHPSGYMQFYSGTIRGRMGQVATGCLK